MPMNPPKGKEVHPKSMHQVKKKDGVEQANTASLSSYLKAPTIPPEVERLANLGQEGYKSKKIVAQDEAKKGGREPGWLKKTFGKKEDDILKELKKVDPPKTYTAGEVNAELARSKKPEATEKVPDFTIVEGVSVNDLHRRPLGDNCVLQVASQFDFQESKTKDDTSVEDYIGDPTQGPQASIEAAAGALHRKAAKSKGALPHALSDMLVLEIGPPPPTSLMGKYPDLYKNGYLELWRITDPVHEKALLTHIESNIDKLRVLPQWVTCEPTGSKQLQVFTAAPSYQNNNPPPLTHKPTQAGTEICKKLVVAQYVATAQLAVIRSRETGQPVPLHLTMVGQGAFGNDPSVMKEAMEAVAKVVKGENVQVYVHAFSPKDVINLKSQISTGPTAPFNTNTVTKEQFKKIEHPSKAKEESKEKKEVKEEKEDKKEKKDKEEKKQDVGTPKRVRPKAITLKVPPLPLDGIKSSSFKAYTGPQQTRTPETPKTPPEGRSFTTDDIARRSKELDEQKNPQPRAKLTRSLSMSDLHSGRESGLPLFAKKMGKKTEDVEELLTAEEMKLFSGEPGPLSSPGPEGATPPNTEDRSVLFETDSSPDPEEKEEVIPQDVGSAALESANRGLLNALGRDITPERLNKVKDEVAKELNEGMDRRIKALRDSKVTFLGTENMGVYKENFQSKPFQSLAEIMAEKKNLGAVLKQVNFMINGARQECREASTITPELKAKLMGLEEIGKMLRSMKTLEANNSKYSREQSVLHRIKIEAILDKQVPPLSHSERTAFRQGLDAVVNPHLYTKRSVTDMRGTGKSKHFAMTGHAKFDTEVGDPKLSKYKMPIKVESTTGGGVNITISVDHRKLYEGKKSFGDLSKDDVKIEEKGKLRRQMEAALTIAIAEHNKGSFDNPIHITYRPEKLRQPVEALALLIDLKKRAALEGKEFFVIHPETKQKITITSDPSDYGHGQDSLFDHYEKQTPPGVAKNASSILFKGDKLLKDNELDKKLETPEERRQIREAYVSRAVDAGQKFRINQMDKVAKELPKPEPGISLGSR